MNEQNVQNKKNTKMATLLISFIIILVLLNSSAFILKTNEYGIVKQFGKIVEVKEKTGLNFKVPFIQSKTVLSKKIMFYDVPPAEINTLDKKRIVVDYYAMWKITDPIKMIESLRSLNGAERRLNDIMYSNIRNELGTLAYGDIINPEDNNRGGIDKVVEDKVNSILANNNSGIEITDIQVKRIDLPESNEESVYNRMISERNANKEEYLSQGEAEYKKIKSSVDREVLEKTATTRAEAHSIIAEGEKEAAKIYNDSYGKSPEFFKLYTTLKSYETTIGKDTVIMLPISSPYLKYLR